MTSALQIASLALALAATVVVLVLVLRRLMLSREQRERDAVETRLRDVALALVDGDAVELPTLAPRDAAVFARMLARYSRQLSGAPRAHIARFFEAGGHVTHQLELLRARPVWRRAAAAATLGDMASGAAIPALLDALDDPEREVRAAATRSLAVLDAPVAVAPIVAALAAGRVQRAVGGWALMKLGESALPSLRELVEHEDADIRAAAVELLGLTGDASDSGQLVERLRDPAAEVRAKAAHALGRLGAADAALALREALGDRIFFVRAAVARALGQIGDRPSAVALVHQAQTDRFEAAQAAARALAELEPVGLAAAAEVAVAGEHLREAAGMAEVLS
jgi:HEAT repeat protein